MGDVSDVRHVKRARKKYSCDWCYGRIEKGDPYDSYFCYDERVTARLHPECLKAMYKADHYDDYLVPGVYRRGCWCGENEEFCKCKEAPRG